MFQLIFMGVMVVLIVVNSVSNESIRREGLDDYIYYHGHRYYRRR